MLFLSIEHFVCSIHKMYVDVCLSVSLVSVSMRMMHCDLQIEWMAIHFGVSVSFLHVCVGVEWSGVEWSGVEWSGVERRA